MKYKNITGKEAWDLLKSDQNSFLVDVRSQDEWDSVGIPDLTSLKKKLIKITWLANDPGFLSQLQVAIPNKNSQIIFLCRGGVRSGAAAEKALESGYKHSYNLIGGFEKGGWDALPSKKNN
jgi:rhodanese-related sulfurtransferase